MENYSPLRSAFSIERPKMAKKRFYSGDYAGYDSRRALETRDAEMIGEDHGAIANLPQGVVYKEYPKIDFYSYNLNDNIRGIDKQMSDDVRGERKKSNKAYPEKY